MYLTAHGGDCCGVTHIHEFYGAPERALGNFQRLLRGFLNEQYDNDDVQVDGYEAKEIYNEEEGYHNVPSDKKFSCILEACLTDAQMEFWAPHMKAAGFKIVNRFLNSNSGNVVNILHYNPAGRRKIEKAPYKW